MSIFSIHINVFVAHRVHTRCAGCILENLAWFVCAHTHSVILDILNAICSRKTLWNEIEKKKRMPTISHGSDEMHNKYSMKQKTELCLDITKQTTLQHNHMQQTYTVIGQPVFDSQTYKLNLKFLKSIANEHYCIPISWHREFCYWVTFQKYLKKQRYDSWDAGQYLRRTTQRLRCWNMCAVSARAFMCVWALHSVSLS